MFIWNGISSDSMDVKVIYLPPISLSQENINEIEIEGRDGNLTEMLGYKTTTKQVEVDYLGEDTYSILNWLKGSGEVIFGNDEKFYYKARINNIVPLEQILRNMHNFPIEFRCQPFRYFISGKRKIIITSSGIILNNFGNKEALPYIKIYGSGNINVNINGRGFTISNLDNSIGIISEIQECEDGKGDLMDGKFPYFDIGKNTLTYSGNVTKIEVTPNWRCL